MYGTSSFQQGRLTMLRQWRSGKTINSLLRIARVRFLLDIVILGIIFKYIVFFLVIILFLVYFNFDG